MNAISVYAAWFHLPDACWWSVCVPYLCLFLDFICHRIIYSSVNVKHLESQALDSFSYVQASCLSCWYVLDVGHKQGPNY